MNYLFAAFLHFRVVQQQPQKYQLIALPYKDGYMSVFPDQILYIEANGNYCKVVSSLGITFTLRKTLKDIELRIEKMESRKVKFLRVHTSYIIRLGEIQYNKDFSEATFRNGDRVPISRPYRKDLEDNLFFF